MIKPMEERCITNTFKPRHGLRTIGLFTRMHLVEKLASGIPRMQADMKEAGLPELILLLMKPFLQLSLNARKIWCLIPDTCL